MFNESVLYNIAYGGVRDHDFKKLVDGVDDGDINCKYTLMKEVEKPAKLAEIHDMIMSKSE